MGTTLCELGVLSILGDDTSQAITGRRATAVLSLLSIDRSRVRTLDDFVEAGWRGDDRPPSARQSITNVISRLRREHGAELIETVGPGYRLGALVTSERERFLALLTAAQEAATTEEVLDATSEAAVLWRGEPWTDLSDIDELRIDQSRLSQAWHRVRSLRAESLHRAGRLDEAQAQWAELASENPLNEDTWIGWAQSLEAADRRVEALRVLDRARHALGECGVLPGNRLRETEERLLSAAGTDRDEPAFGKSPLPYGVDQRPDLVVGRESVFAELEAAWGDIDRTGQVVIIEGNAGIGKSTVVAELAHRVANTGGKVLFGAADDVLQIPFQPFVLAFDNDGDDLGERDRRDLGIGVRSGNDATTDADSTFQVIDRLHHTIRSIAAESATLLLIEDVHWADGETVLAVRSLARRLPRGVMIVVTTRPLDGPDLTEHHSGLLDDAARIRSVRRIHLDALSTPEAGELLARTAPGLEISPDTADLIGGNPLLLVEYATTRPLDRDVQPETTLAAVHLRTLVADERRSIELAATLGESFWEDDLIAATERDPAEIQSLLTKAADRGLIRATDAGPWRFRHALVRDAILDGLAPHVLALRHLEVGTALARGHRPRPSEIARHFLASGSAGRDHACVWLERAAEAATRAGAHEQAARHWSELVSVIDPRSLETLRRAHFEHASALARTGQWERSREPYEHAIRLASELDDAEAHADAIIGWTRAPEDQSGQRRLPDFVLDTEALDRRVDPVRASKLMALRSIDAFDRTSMSEAHELIQGATELADESRDAEAIAFVQRARFRTWWDPDQLEARYRAAQRLATLGRTHDSADITAYAIRWQVIYGVEAGRLATSMHLCRSLIAIGNRRGEPFHTWFGWSRLAVTHLATGDVSSSHDAFRRADDIADLLGTHYVRAAHENVRAGIEVQTGPIPELSPGRPVEERGLMETLLNGDLGERAAMLETIAPEDLAGLVGLNGDMPPTIIWCPIAIAAAATGSEPHARALLPLLSPLRERACIQIPATAFLGPISLVVASLRDLVGDDEGAAHDYEHAVRWSEQIGATTAAAIALHALAAHHHRCSEPTVAADLESRARRLVPAFDLATVPMTRALTRHPAG